MVAAGWVRDLLGLPADCGVGIVTGCQMARFTCLAAARHSVLRDADWDVEAHGLQGAPGLRVIASDQVHVTVPVACRMLGLGAERVRLVPTDDQGRMVAAELETALAEHPGPTIVCAQAGEINTGAFDPLAEIVELCRARDAWCHIDGAFGLWAALSPHRRGLLEGFERVYSWATDGHKWLNVPYDCGIALGMADRLAQADGVEVLNDVVLNQVLVRFDDDDQVTHRVIERTQEDGTCWVSGSMFRGRTVMRISVVGWQTTADDVIRSAEAILAAARPA
jgi:glutamate/tyrosine decarboxylase-like PLP-dependent enzyme